MGFEIDYKTIRWQWNYVCREDYDYYMKNRKKTLLGQAFFVIFVEPVLWFGLVLIVHFYIQYEIYLGLINIPVGMRAEENLAYHEERNGKLVQRPYINDEDIFGYVTRYLFWKIVG